MPGSWTHLASRFFGGLRARDLDPDEVRWIREILSEPEFALFMAQPIIDRRHGHESATSMSRHTTERDVIRAAALHDVGKRHARLGLIGRSLASACIKLGLPLTNRFQTYHNHPEIGRRELVEAGSPHVVVSFTGAHHGTRPADIDETTWRQLVDSDNRTESTQSVQPGR